jgi:hypothetical protein
MTLPALLVTLLLPLHTGPTPTASFMQADVDRLVRAAEGRAGTWPPPPIAEVAIVARHGKAVVPSVELLSDDPNAERESQALEDTAAGCASR